MDILLGVFFFSEGPLVCKVDFTVDLNKNSNEFKND